MHVTFLSLCTMLHVTVLLLSMYTAVAAAVSKWQELKLLGGLEGIEDVEEEDIYSEARMAEV